MNDYYVLVGLNKKKVNILSVVQNDKGIIKVSVERKK